MFKKISLLAATAIAFSAFTGTASAQSSNSGYLMDLRGGVAKSGFGLCWRTGSWTPAMATAECDPDLDRKSTRLNSSH